MPFSCLGCGCANAQITRSAHDQTVSRQRFHAQLFEFLLTLVGNRRYQSLIGGELASLVRTSIAYMQMTAAQANGWAADANQYIADEEEDFGSVRAEGEMLLDALCEVRHVCPSLHDPNFELPRLASLPSLIPPLVLGEKQGRRGFALREAAEHPCRIAIGKVRHRPLPPRQNPSPSAPPRERRRR
jgi:hypothetical protein